MNQNQNKTKKKTVNPIRRANWIKLNQIYLDDDDDAMN